jgi:tetratricopeptide (TPR) repeat protein
MPKQRSETVEQLLGSVQWALSKRLGARDLVPMLKRLVARTVPRSPEWMFAQRELARVLVEPAPWQAALLARRLLQIEDDPQTRAVLGLAQTLLGNYRSACAAYRRALLLAPESPEYAHNLGHLLDVALERPRDALAYLRAAQRELPDEPEVAASLAHALVRTGAVDEARRLLQQSLSDDAAVERWLTSWQTADPPGSTVVDLGGGTPSTPPAVARKR